jgi:hypothetical protein
MWIFTLPFVALGFRWEDLIAVLFFILNYQFFIHTELIKTLGPLEYLVQTPSLHRVHHATQDEYLDKNFGGITLLFDYVFGTIQREINEIKPAYGLRDEPIHRNVFSIVLFGWMQMIREIWRSPCLADKIKRMVFLKAKAVDLVESKPPREFDFLSPLSLSLFRIGLGSLWLFILVYRFSEISFFFADDGILSLRDSMDLVGGHRFSLLFWATSTLWIKTVFIVGILSAGCLVLGIFSNFSAGIGWLICVSLLNRAEVIISGGDMYLLVFLLAATFLPLDRHFSLIRGQLRPSKLKTVIYRSAQFTFLVQIVCIYFFAGVLKHGGLWMSGDALSVILQLKLTTRELGRYLPQFPDALRTFTHLIPWFEMSAIILLMPFRRLNRIKDIWLALAIGMHISILFTMNVFYLPYVCLVALVALIPSRFWGATLRLKESSSFSFTTWRPLTLSISSAFSLFVIALNIHSTYRPFLPASAYSLVEKFRLEQYWNFFGPSPRQANTWWSVNGKVRDGSPWYWGQMKSGFEDAEPLYPARMYKSLDWAVFFLGLAHPDYQERLLPILGRYLCRQPNVGADTTGQLPEVITISLYESRIFPETTEPKRVREFRKLCRDSTVVLE